MFHKSGLTVKIKAKHRQPAEIGKETSKTPPETACIRCEKDPDLAKQRDVGFCYSQAGSIVGFSCSFPTVFYRFSYAVLMY